VSAAQLQVERASAHALAIHDLAVEAVGAGLKVSEMLQKQAGVRGQLVAKISKGEPSWGTAEKRERIAEKSLRPVLYAHDTMLPAGGDVLRAWLGGMQLEFQLNVMRNHPDVIASGVEIEIVWLNALELPPYFTALDVHRRGLPALLRGETLHSGVRAIIEVLAAIFPTVQLSLEHGLNEPTVTEELLESACAWMQCACVPSYRAPQWGGPEMDAINNKYRPSPAITEGG
jgi:hypothetical protein